MKKQEKIDKLQQQLEEEWSNMHHNARIHNWPDIKTVKDNSSPLALYPRA